MIDETKIANGIEMILDGLGLEDWECDQHLKETPERAARGFAEIFSGYDENPEEFLKTFEERVYDDMLIVGPIQAYSVCSHHFLPFTMDIYIGYIPDRKIIGISKFVRIARTFSKRLQVQERITQEIADFIDSKLQPKGTMVLIKNSEHMCMKMRGVKDPCANVTTSAVKGVFADHSKGARQEFLQLIKG